MNAYAVCLIFLGVFGVANSGCPDLWSCHGKTCYKVITAKANRATQKTACENLGGFLAEPKSQCDNVLIKSIITETSFIGFNDMGKEGTWVSDTLGDAPGYTNWASGEPNDFHPGEDCMEMYTSGKWNDIFCTHSRPAVCEKTQCPHGFQSKGKKCYKVVNDKATYDNAKAACESLGAFLAEPLSAGESNAIKSLITETSFTGFNDKTKEGTWVRNSNGASLSYTNWAGGEPNDYHPGEDCSEMYTSGKWNDIFCTTKRAYVCEV